MAIHVLRGSVDAVAAGSDQIVSIGRSPVRGTIIAASFWASTALTGADTDSRTLSILNGGADGSGTTEAASKAFTSGVNGAAQRECQITLSGTAANIAVSKGDILHFKSLHVGATGLAMPAGTVEIVIQEGLS